MSGEVWASVWAAAITLVCTLLGFWLTQGIRDARAARRAHQQGIATNEQQTRRDSQADWAAFAAEMRQALAAERADSAAKQSRIDALEERMTAATTAWELERRGYEDHIDALEAHIWQQLPPPPPQRPATRR